MSTTLFRVRTPLQGIDNEQEVIDVLNELATLGWDANQWSEDKADVVLEDLHAMFPSYQNASEDEKSEMFDQYYETLADQFFIETFGNGKKGYLRSDCATLLACAQNNLRKAKVMASCTKHVWAYTHHNGHKTCELCNTFADCSVEEAKAHYEVGHVTVDDHKVLYFHRHLTLCVCGSHEVYYLSDAMFLETKYRCIHCRSFIPARYDNTSFSRHSVFLSPTDKKYPTGDANPTKRLDHDYHRIPRLGARSISSVNENINRYIVKMINHWLYVMDEPFEDGVKFTAWLSPHLSHCLEKSKFQIQHQDTHFNVVDIKSLCVSRKEEKYEIGFSFALCKTTNIHRSGEQIMTDILTALTTNKKRES